MNEEIREQNKPSRRQFVKMLAALPATAATVGIPAPAEAVELQEGMRLERGLFALRDAALTERIETSARYLRDRITGEAAYLSREGDELSVSTHGWREEVRRKIQERQIEHRLRGRSDAWQRNNVMELEIHNHPFFSIQRAFSELGRNRELTEKMRSVSTNESRKRRVVSGFSGGDIRSFSPGSPKILVDPGGMWVARKATGEDWSASGGERSAFEELERELAEKPPSEHPSRWREFEASRTELLNTSLEEVWNEEKMSEVMEKHIRSALHSYGVVVQFIPMFSGSRVVRDLSSLLNDWDFLK